MHWQELLTRIKTEKQPKESHGRFFVRYDPDGTVRREPPLTFDPATRMNLFPLVTLKRPNRRGSRSNGCITQRESSSR